MCFENRYSLNIFLFPDIWVRYRELYKYVKNFKVSIAIVIYIYLIFIVMFDCITKIKIKI